MSGVLSFPFQLGKDGAAVTVPHGSDLEVEQAIAVLVLTRLGERVMEPLFGTLDPLMTEVTADEIQLGLNEFGPEGIAITSVETEPVAGSDTLARATVNWVREDDDDDIGEEII